VTAAPGVTVTQKAQISLDIKSVSFHRAAYRPEDFPRDKRPQFAIVGRSNVGKSSLINALINRKGMARVSQTPGKTQAVQFYLVNDRFYLVDLPGYGYARVPKEMKKQWGELVRGYLDSSDDIRLLLLLLDVRRTPGEHDLQMHEWTTTAGIDEKVVLTKADKLSNQQLMKSRDAIAKELGIGSADLIAASAVTRKGIEEIRREMFARL
jgi:GTP-binding protein